MRVSTKGRYGLRAMVDIAEHLDDCPLSIKTIAERQGISESYLEQVFSALKKGGLVKSVRGACGGYELSMPPEKITAGRVIRLLEGSVAPVMCVDKCDSDSCDNFCENSEKCRTHPFWRGLGNMVNNYIDSVTIRQLADFGSFPDRM